MIEKTIEQVPATTRTRERHVCDLCGKKTEPGDREWHLSDAEAYPKRVAAADITVSSVVNRHGWESDGSREGEAWDFCPDCFRDRVRPLLVALAEPRKVDESW